MSLKIQNTLTRTLEEVEPQVPGEIRMYTCGPTVYDYAHIGNFRAYMFEDLLRRHLKFLGFKVTQVMNLTDVDDKTIRGAGEAGLPLKEFTRKYVESFFEDLDALGIERAEEYPAATDHISEMITLIQTLVDKGFAYVSDDGSVYFSIAKFDGYGKLAHLDLEGMQSGARVSQDEYEKDVAADFALWKAWTEKDGDVAWDSPWGRGRPGWHIECSAMSMKYLGESFDIHTGGTDNMFPHHEDEIAQSEAATGKTFVKYWMHCAHLIVDGKKMSKSLGNFHTLRDIFDKGYTGREVRYVLIGTHYRQTLNFSFEALDAARAALGRIDEFTSKVKDLLERSAKVGRTEKVGRSVSLSRGSRANSRLTGDGSPYLRLEEIEARFTEALNDDLNISAARAVVFDLVTDGNKALDQGSLSGEQAGEVLALMDRMDTVLGFLKAEEAEIDAAVQDLLDQRADARKNKQWADSDRIRDELAELGWIVQDTPGGQKVKKG